MARINAYPFDTNITDKDAWTKAQWAKNQFRLLKNKYVKNS